ncbi:MAG: Phytoene synthase, partial [uncultured Craurococcus sp.]
EQRRQHRRHAEPRLRYREFPDRLAAARQDSAGAGDGLLPLRPDRRRHRRQRRAAAGGEARPARRHGAEPRGPLDPPQPPRHRHGGGAADALRLPPGRDLRPLCRLGRARGLLPPLRRPGRPHAPPSPRRRRQRGSQCRRRRPLHRAPGPEPPAGPGAGPRPARPHLPAAILDGPRRRRGRLLRPGQHRPPPRGAGCRPRPRRGAARPRLGLPPPAPLPPPRLAEHRHHRARPPPARPAPRRRSGARPRRIGQGRFRPRLRRGAPARPAGRADRRPPRLPRRLLLRPRHGGAEGRAAPCPLGGLRLLPRRRRHRRRRHARGGEAPLPRRLAPQAGAARLRPLPRARLGPHRAWRAARGMRGDDRRHGDRQRRPFAPPDRGRSRPLLPPRRRQRRRDERAHLRRAGGGGLRPGAGPHLPAHQHPPRRGRGCGTRPGLHPARPARRRGHPGWPRRGHRPPPPLRRHLRPARRPGPGRLRPGGGGDSPVRPHRPPSRRRHGLGLSPPAGPPRRPRLGGRATAPTPDQGRKAPHGLDGARPL